MEFHISRQARDYYQFDKLLFALDGNVILANFHAARLFAQKMNSKRDLVTYPEQAVKASQINAMGLIDEILHILIRTYRQQNNLSVMHQALDWLYGMLGQEAVDATLLRFNEEFPPLEVYQRQITAEEYLEGVSEGVSHRVTTLEEMIVLWLTNLNPAMSSFLELYDDDSLKKETEYIKVFPLLHAFFETQPAFGPDGQNLLDVLRAPALAHPHSLTDQLEFIRKRWSSMIANYLFRLLSSLDLIREEEKPVFGVGGPGPALVYEFRGMEFEPENFSPDKDWMPQLVLLAKNIYVWLDQLSKKYQQEIRRLDQIPDSELDTLTQWGFSGLWMIGLWERSNASRTIKQWRGNPEAVASAYSLYDYQIAADLGGDEAYQSLRVRAWKRGLRLASDMVPNHMGIDSHWVIEHPDWFVSLDYPPFPTYSYSGANVSTDSRVSVFIEDHYFNNSDAAVTFKRLDTWTGDTRYIYHGNDGTSMPWNDTAQLNYLKHEVREAVIQTILHVARKFPIIRFDAAMTLAKKHYQRLWFPEPGSGGDIASRAEFGLTKEQFDAAMPNEFWREVVDRVAQEVPDTLLLAEAFWLMEGYFVRTLGMHRVYNSAFMNMLRDEKNAEYRLVIKNTLEFDPEILKRYVNFMNNPDERTAVDQFGKGDKYFGICALMATMPGLPMFGHGQIEGFTEKYGMEYQRAYWNEQVDDALVERHKREIFPLLRRRYLFAEVQNFRLYDFFTPEGQVDEDVFVYSNRSGEERSLVVCHNRYSQTRGWINTSAAYSVKTDSGERSLSQVSLSDGLGLNSASNMYTIFRDHGTGLEYLRNNREIHDKGLYFELAAYEFHVFLNFRQVTDNEWSHYGQLASYLQGRGVPSVDEAMKEILLRPVRAPFEELVNAGMLRWIITNRQSSKQVTEGTQVEAALSEAEEKYLHLLAEVRSITQSATPEAPINAEMRAKLKLVISLSALGSMPTRKIDPTTTRALNFLNPGDKTVTGALSKSLKEGEALAWGPLLGWIFAHDLGKISGEKDYAEVSRSWIDEWLLGKILANSFQDLGLADGASWQSVRLIKVLVVHHNWWQLLDKDEESLSGRSEMNAQRLLEYWLNDREVQLFLSVNRYQDVLWFNNESLEALLWWLLVVAMIDMGATEKSNKPSKVYQKRLLACLMVLEKLTAALKASEYQVSKLIAAAA